MIDLKAHKALITGSTQGVGRSIALAFAAAGADVLLHGKDADQNAPRVLAECRAKGAHAEFIPLDLIGESDALADRLFSDAQRLLPGIDILVNNAGQYFDLPFDQMTLDRFDRTMRLNVYAPYFLTQRFAQAWISAGTRGRVLMVGSINGRLAEPNSTAYDTSKGALEMMVKTLAASLARRGIRINGLAPGLVRTPQTAWIDRRPQAARWIEQHTPTGTIPDSAVCGDAAVYLCSDAASHIHGHMLMVDGGMSAWQHPSPPVTQ
jgi:NAD(P)-dependent dehydrogenase (short-subunit alcohol dehydrogenase family)